VQTGKKIPSKRSVLLNPKGESDSKGKKNHSLTIEKVIILCGGGGERKKCLMAARKKKGKNWLLTHSLDEPRCARKKIPSWVEGRGESPFNLIKTREEGGTLLGGNSTSKETPTVPKRTRYVEKFRDAECRKPYRISGDRKGFLNIYKIEGGKEKSLGPREVLRGKRHSGAQILDVPRSKKDRQKMEMGKVTVICIGGGVRIIWGGYLSFTLNIKNR